MSKIGAKAERARRAPKPSTAPVRAASWPTPQAPPPAHTAKVPAAQLAMLLQLVGGSLGVDTDNEQITEQILRARSLTISIDDQPFVRLEVGH